jgi:hypothetical protein
MRLVSIHAHGRLYAPAPDQPSASFFRHLCELGAAELEQLQYGDAEHWFRAAYDHVPRVVDAQAREVAMRFLIEADRIEDGRLRAHKLCAACAVLRGELP